MSASAGTLRIAYVVSRFPKLSETFVLTEMVALEKLGAEIVVYPLIVERTAVVHPDATRLADAGYRRHRPRWAALLRAQVAWLRRRPGAYLGEWLTIARELWRSPRQLVRAAAVLPQSAEFARDMIERRVDHVHAHFANHPTVAAHFISNLTGIPFSFTAHAHDIHVDRRMLRRKIDDSAFAVTISEFNRQLMSESGGDPSKLTVIHCGVDLDLFHPTAARADGGSLSIVCVGSLEPKKGQRYLVDALRRLVDRGVDARLTLIGDGPDRGSLARQIATLDLDGRVTMKLGLPRDAVAAALRECDVVALASVPLSSGRMEGIPVALMEAMASGRPVVSTRISGIPELVEDGVSGYLVPPRDSAALASALARLADDPELRRTMGLAGRDRVAAEFALHRSAQELLAMIRRVSA